MGLLFIRDYHPFARPECSINIQTAHRSLEFVRLFRMRISHALSSFSMLDFSIRTDLDCKLEPDVFEYSFCTWGVRNEIGMFIRWFDRLCEALLLDLTLSGTNCVIIRLIRTIWDRIVLRWLIELIKMTFTESIKIYEERNFCWRLYRWMKTIEDIFRFTNSILCIATVHTK